MAELYLHSLVERSGQAVTFVTSSKIQSVLGGKVNILGGHGIGNSKQKSVYVHVSYS
jgi:hypothetical protein